MEHREGVLTNVSEVMPTAEATNDTTHSNLQLLHITTTIHFIIMTYWEPLFSIFSISANVCFSYPWCKNHKKLLIMKVKF